MRPEAYFLKEIVNGICILDVAVCGSHPWLVGLPAWLFGPPVWRISSTERREDKVFSSSLGN